MATIDDPTPAAEAAPEPITERVRWAVLEECQGHLGGEPHATTWGRHGYRQVPALCDRCARLTTRLLTIIARET